MYKYEALLLGGLPEEGLARAGLKVSSKVLISAAAQNIYMLKVKIKIMCKQQCFYFLISNCPAINIPIVTL